MKIKQLEELLLQSLEHEMGGVKVYAAALTCVQNPDLKKEWTKYHEQTRTHVTALEGICKALNVDAKQETPGRKVVRTVGGALVEAMKLAKDAGDPAAAELVACESVVLAEVKDHADWELLGKCADHLEGAQKKSAQGCLRRDRGPGGRAPLPHQGMVPGAVASVTRLEGRPATTRGSQGGQDRDRCRPRRTIGGQPPLTIGPPNTLKETRK